MTEINQLLRIFDDNKIDYARKFKDIEINGYDSNQCQNLSFEIRRDIDYLLRLGFSNGFDSTIKNCIYELTEIAVLMSKDRIALKLDKYIQERQNIMDKIRKYKGDKKMVDIKKEVLLYIDDSLSGLDNIILQEKNGYNKSILNTSKELLEELRGKVDNVFDNSSKDASDFAANLLGDSKYGLFAWRDYVGRNMLFDAVNDHLREAINEADKWGAITVAPAKKNLAKDSDVVKYQEDVFSSFAKVSSVTERGNAFFARLHEFEEQFNAQSEFYDKIREINADIGEMQKEIQAIIEKLDNGEIFEEEADTQITMLEQDIEIKESERDQYRASIRMMNNNILAMRRLISKFKRLELIYKMYQQIEPNLFYTMFEYIDFRQFLNILSYGASEEDITIALSYYDNIMENVTEQTKHMARTDSRFAGINSIMEKQDQAIRNKSESNTADREKEKEELKKRMEARRQRYGKKPQPAQQQAQPQQQEQEGMQNLDIQISDILNNNG